MMVLFTRTFVTNKNQYEKCVQFEIKKKKNSNISNKTGERFLDGIFRVTPNSNAIGGLSIIEYSLNISGGRNF